MSINDFISAKPLLITLSLVVFVSYIMDDNMKKVMIKT